MLWGICCGDNVYAVGVYAVGTIYMLWGQFICCGVYAVGNKLYAVGTMYMLWGICCGEQCICCGYMLWVFSPSGFIKFKHTHKFKHSHKFKHDVALTLAVARSMRNHHVHNFQSHERSHQYRPDVTRGKFVEFCFLRHTLAT